MADDDHLNVDLDIGSNQLEASLRRTFDLMQVGFERAERIRISMENTAAAARRYGEGMANLNRRLEGAGTDFERNAVENAIKQRTADQAAYNKELREEMQLQRELNLARGAARRVQDQTRQPDGRTNAEVRGTEAALRDAITGINTSSEQMAARLALATGKAMERLLGSTADAIEKSYAVAQQRQMSRNAQLSVPGYLEARVTNDRVAAELAVERAQQGGTLADRRARADRAAQLEVDRRAAETKEREYQQYRASLRATEIREDLKDATRADRAEALRERADADRLNKERDAAIKRGSLREWEAAQAENKERDSLARRAALRERDDASRLNKEFTTTRSGDAGLRAASRDQGFFNRTGVERSDFQARIVAENLSLEQQKVILRQLVAERRAASSSQAPDFTQMAERGFAAQRARFDLNGGADQFAMQARLTANYATFGLITGAIRGAMSAIVEFDENLVKFQAITGAANSEMDGFRKNLLEVAANSKFSVNELTTVAIALGQTGLAASEVTKALKPVADLAAASGATLQQSVEAITGVLGAYNMEAGRAGEVADVFVAALNRTKLTMEQLQLGIQYAANIARDSNVSFSELTASIGAIAQAGVKSGSTIGTGMRQLITELAAPSEKLRNVLKEVGINLADVDLRTQGFSGVLQNLQKAGFGTAEALRSMDLRAAAAFSALVGQADKLSSLQKEFLLTSAATEGAAKANESLSAAGQRLSNTVFALVDTAFTPFVKVLTATVGKSADLASAFQALGPTLPIIAAGLASIATAAAGIKIAQLLQGLGGMLASGGLIGAPALIGGAAIGAAGGLVYYLTTVQNEAEKAQAALDVLKKSENELTSRQSTLQQRSTDLDRQIQTLIDRRDKLNSDPLLRETAIIEAQKAFGDLGLAADPARTSVDELIKSLQGLRGELGKELPVILAEQVSNLGKKIEELNRLQAARARGAQVRVGTVSNDVAGVGSLVDVDPLDDITRLDGKTPGLYSTMAEVIRDPRLLGDNPLGNAAPYRRQALQEVDSLRMDATRRLIAGDTRGAEALDRRIDQIEKALTRLNEVIGTATELQAAEQQRRTARAADAAAELQNTPEYQAIKAARDELSGRQERAVIEASRTPGFSGFTAMQAAARSTTADAQAQLDRIKELKEAAVAAGTTDEDRARLRAAADDAYREVTTGFELILRGGGKEIRERFAVSAPAQKAALSASIRSDEAQLQLLQRQAGLSRDPASVANYQALATQIQGEINAARERLFAIEVGQEGADAEKMIAANPELQKRREEIKEQAQTKLTQLATTYGEIHRKLQDALLSYQVQGEQDRRGLIQEQIKGLEKVRDDVRSTPEQMRAAVQEINRLLGEVATIGKGINALQAGREALKVPQGQIPASVSFSAGSVQQRIVDELRASGASEERIRYALTTGQIESGYAPDVISGARRSSAGATGLFQFMPKTWNNMYGTRDVNTDVSAQLRAFQQFTDRNAGTWQSNMGRGASAEELYLMHQQGAAGAMALTRAGSGSALDALTRVYGDAGTASRAITGNGGRADMAADEFIQLILRKFRSAENRVGNPFATTGDKEVARRRQLADDTTAEETENSKAQNERKARESERQRTLAELRQNNRALTESYDTSVALAKKLQDPTKALEASGTAFGQLRQLYDNAQKQDESSRFGESPEQQQTSRDATRRRFADLYAQQGLGVADNIGRAKLKEITDQLERLEAQRKELERPENQTREGNTQLLVQLNEQINVLQKRKELEGDYEANQQKLVVLEQTLKEMKAAGLDTDRDTMAVRERIRDITDQQKKLEGTRTFAAKQAGTDFSLGEATSGAIYNFERSRGILDPLGRMVNETQQAQKLIEGSLNTIGNAFDSLFVNLFNGSMKAGDALKKFASDILGGLMSQISKSLTNDIFKAIFSAGSSGGGGGLGELLSSVFSFSPIPGFALGGPIRMAGGGGVPVRDAALAMRDSQLVQAMPGEYLLRKSAVDAIGRETLDQVNALGTTMVNRAPKVDTRQKFGGSSASANVYVVDRDQVPPPSRNEIVHMIGDDIQRGGSLKQLIKRVQVGG